MDTQPLMELAEAHVAAARLKEAGQLYAEVLRGIPDHSESLYRLGEVATMLGQHRAALSFLDRAIKLRPGRPGGADSPVPLFLRQALAYGPADALVWARLCASLGVLGEARGSEQAARRASTAAIGPDDARLTGELLLGCHASGAAEECFRRA